MRGGYGRWIVCVGMGFGCCWTSAWEALIMFACGRDGVFGPREFFEAFLFDRLVGFDAEPVGSFCDSCECFVDLNDELAVGSCEIEVEALLEAFGPELCGVACGLCFAGV